MCCFVMIGTYDLWLSLNWLRLICVYPVAYNNITTLDN